jgi:PAS domain S-box-containing protein
MLKILSIDDHKDNLISLKALIREAFPDSINLAAENGPAGIDLALSEDPDVILLDVVMPIMDGFEVCRKLKSNPNTSDIPVVFLTALKGDRQNRIRALEVGAEAFLAKPIDEIELTAQIRAMGKIKIANNQKRQEKEDLAQLVAEQTRELEFNHTATLKLVEDLRNENLARKLNEIALQESEARYKSMFENNHAVMLIIDPDNGAILEANPAACAYYGWSYEELVSMKMSQINTLPTEKVHSERQLAHNENRKAFAFKHRRADGSIRDVEVFTGPLMITGKNVFYSIIHDVSDRKKAEQALVESQALLNSIIESTSDLIWSVDPLDFGLFTFNSSFQDYFLKRRAIAISKGMRPDELFPEEEHIHYWQKCYQRTLDEGPFTEEYREYASTLTLQLTFNLLKRDGKVFGISVFGMDVTESKQAEEALRNSETRFRTLFEQAAIGVMLTDTKTGQYVTVNQKWCDILGYTREELVGSSYLVYTHPDDLLTNEDNNALMLAGKIREYSIEKRYICKDGSTVWGNLTVSPMWTPDEEPSVYYHIAIVQDITESKLAEEALRKSEKKYQTLFATMSEGVALNELIYDEAGEMVDYRITEVNPAFYETADFTGPVLGNIATKLYGMTPDFIKSFWREHKSKNTVQLSEMTSPLKGRTYLVSTSPFVNDMFVTSFMDITERKQAEEKLRENEEKYRNLFNNSEVGMFITRLDGSEILEFNDKYLNILGRTMDEVKGKPSVNMWADKRERERLVQLLKTKGHVTDFECGILNKQGEVRWCVTSLRLYGNLGVLEGSILDITERKRAEKAVLENQMMLANILDSVPQAIFWKDCAGVFLGCNENFVRTVGVTGPDQIVGKTDYDLSASNVEADIFRADDLEVISQNQPKRHIIEQVRAADGTAIWADTTKTPLMDAAGKPYGVLGVYEDITERKQMEDALRESEEKFAKVFHDSPVWIVITDWSDATYLEVNEEALRATGFSREETIGRTGVEIGWLTGSDRARLVQEILDHGRINGLEMAFHAKDGRPLYGLVNGEQVEIGGRLCLLTVTTDITDRKLADKQINDQLIELRRWYSAMLGREKRTLELKKEVNDLLMQAGQPPRYASPLEVQHE